MAVYKDISQLKKAEEELRDTLKKLETMNEKLRVVGRLTRHDLRNKLSVVTGNLYFAKKKLPVDHKISEHLEGIKSAGEQMVRIFEFARAYEMLGAEELVYVDVEEKVAEAVSLFSNLNGVRIVNSCHGLTALADSLLRQLFYNLIDNSLKYGEKLKTIVMRYEDTGTDRLELIYEDDGVGIPDAEKKKLFQEGYGKGTGYGLYLIRKICQVYGWDIQETGKEGKGAQFKVTIPRVNERGRICYKLG
jgi:signal transduction histidine kinase